MFKKLVPSKRKKIEQRKKPSFKSKRNLNRQTFADESPIKVRKKRVKQKNVFLSGHQSLQNLVKKYSNVKGSLKLHNLDRTKKLEERPLEVLRRKRLKNCHKIKSKFFKSKTTKSKKKFKINFHFQKKLDRQIEDKKGKEKSKSKVIFEGIDNALLSKFKTTPNVAQIKKSDVTKREKKMKFTSNIMKANDQVFSANMIEYLATQIKRKEQLFAQTSREKRLVNSCRALIGTKRPVYFKRSFGMDLQGLGDTFHLLPSSFVVYSETNFKY